MILIWKDPQIDYFCGQLFTIFLGVALSHTQQDEQALIDGAHDLSINLN